MKTTWAFQVRAEADVLDLDVYDVIGDWFGGSSAKDILDKLSAAKNVKQINIRINSIGGVVDDGIAMYNLLGAHSAKKTVYVDGLAASIASVLAMAGDEIIMAESAMMMIHNPWGLAIGGAEEMRKTADLLDKHGDRIAGIYAARTGQAVDDVKAEMSAETWMTAIEAKAKKYATKVTPSKKLAAKVGQVLDLSIFPTVPGAVAAAAVHALAAPEAEEKEHATVAERPAGSSNDQTAATTQQKASIMNKEELRQQHRDLYDSILAEGQAAGVTKERDRVTAHLVMGESSGDLKLAIASINDGAEMTQVLNAKYMSAAMNRRDRNDRQADSNAAGAALDGAALPAANAAPGAGDATSQGIDLFLASRGKRAASG